MSYSVQTLKGDLEGVLHGTTTNQIQNLDGVINRAARQLLLDLDPQETKRTVEFVNPIFNTVYDYPIADDVKGNKIIDIIPQVNRIPRDTWMQGYNQAFDVAKSNIFTLANMFTMNFNTGLKTIRINAPFLNAPIIINQADNIDDNGTWDVNGNASNLTVNNTNFAQGSGSLQFDITTGLGGVYNTTMSAVNLEAHLNQSSLFTWVYVSTGADLDGVVLKWGSSPSDYYSVTVTENQQGNSFVNGWNLCEFVWDGAAVVGTPDVTAISTVEVDLAVSSDMTACKVNGVNSILGSILSYEYYSKYMFRDAITGAFQETVTDDSNLINLDTESFNLLFNQVAYLATQQQQGVDATAYDGGFFKNAYDQGIIKYKSMYKSELQKPQSIYYGMPPRGYGRYLGRNWN